MSSFLDGTGLGHLIEKIKATFIAKTDTTIATSIGIDSTPTTNSTNLVTSGGVKSALDNKANSSDLSTVATTGSYNDLSNKPTIPTVNNSTITILKNSSTVNSFTLNQSSNKTINITVPTTASDVSALPASTKYGASLSVSIDSTTYVVTALLKDLNGNNLGTAQTIDLPLESVVVSGSYDSATKKVVLTLKDGSTIDFSIADLVSGLLTEITSTNKLSADLIEDGTTNKVINVQSDWNVSDTTSNAYILNKPSIPNDSNLVHKTGNETISGIKSFQQIKRTNPVDVLNEAWNWITYKDMDDEYHTLQQALDERNNVQSDWNETNNSSLSYIKNKPEIPSKLSDLTQDINYAASGTVGGAALKTGSIPFGVVDSTSTATAFTATVDGITELTNGTCVLLKNGVVTSAAGFTIDINNLGAHPVFNNLSAATAETTIFNVNYTMLFVYDSTRVVGESTGAWCCYRGYDSNTNTIGYQLRSNSYTKDMADKTYRYRILFSSADNSKWVPSNTSTSTSATASKTVCQTPINPFGEIVYYGTTASVAAGSRPVAANLWQQYTLALGYSFNRTGKALTLTPWEPVYVKCAPQANGSAIIDSTTPYVQSLPSTDDGKIYIFLGVAYSATNIELLMNHPVFYYKDGAIRSWANTADTTLGTLNTNNTTALTASSSESFGGTINLHKVSKTGSYNDLLNKPTIPDDSNLVHKTGNEIINGDKTFNGDIIIDNTNSYDIIGKFIAGPDFSWIKSQYGKFLDTTYTLQQALDERNNIQADWNQTDNTADDYIKNKPTIPAALIQADWNQTTTTSLDYIKNKPYIKSNRGGEPDSMVTNIGQLGTDSFDHYIYLAGRRVFVNTDNGAFQYNNKEVATKNDIPTNVSAFTNDAGYLTSYTETDPTVPAWAKASTKPTYTAAEVGALPDTTVIPDAPGTLNTNNSTAQTVSSSESLSGTINLHKISKTGNYNDLLNKPSIPVDSDLVHTTGDEQISGNKTFRANGSIRLLSGWNQIYNEDDSESLLQALNLRNNVQSDWNETNSSSDAYILNKPDLSIYAQSSNLATVATSGSYNDLSDKPTIPTVNNGTLSISGPSGSSTVTTDVFHANLSGDSLIAFSPGTNTTINVNSSTRTITIGTTAEPNVQSNWNETNTSSDAYILNKPTIPDITGKADKVTGAVTGNFATLDSNGNLTDSGYNYDDLNELSDLYTPATESSELAPGDTYEEAFGKLEKTITDNEYVTAQALNDLNTNKQDTLESGTNIKTINGESILGSGDFSVTGDCIAYPSFEIDSNGHLIMSGGQQGLFTLENGHLMYNF